MPAQLFSLRQAHKSSTDILLKNLQVTHRFCCRPHKESYPLNKKEFFHNRSRTHTIQMRCDAQAFSCGEEQFQILRKHTKSIERTKII